jgi:hypothetical protein
MGNAWNVLRNEVIQGHVVRRFGMEIEDTDTHKCIRRISFTEFVKMTRFTDAVLSIIFKCC